MFKKGRQTDKVNIKKEGLMENNTIMKRPDLHSP
jgi:hypothetical protein